MYTIITDSATDMPEWVIKKYDLKVIPTPVVIDGTDYFDGATIFPGEFYDIQRSGAVISTYHINEFMFTEAFRPYAEAGKEVVYFCFSTGIAGTFGAANLAKKDILEDYPDFKIDIVDSKCASIGFGLCVYMALIMQEKGATKEEVLEAARFHFDNMEHIFTVETLEYLYKGGRLSRPAAIAGTLLDIKPIIEVTDEGKLQVCEKVRGRKKAIDKVISIIEERGVDLDKQIIAVVHADCEELCDEFIERIKAQFGCKTVLKGFLGCAIGAHTGPGLIGICALSAASPYRKYFEEYIE
ncbi:MAG: DegV family protein [Lachnospiraceae bacterium]|nr:DegV family protein [Lachnospiraceae bacterium]